MGTAVYQFENICTKNANLYLQDGIKKIIINADAVENTKDKDLKAFLEYMKTGISTSEFTRRLNNMVETIKDKVTARTEYNFVPGYIMDAKYEERKLAQKEIDKAKDETQEAKDEIKRLKAELEKLKNKQDNS